MKVSAHGYYNMTKDRNNSFQYYLFELSCDFRYHKTIIQSLGGYKYTVWFKTKLNGQMKSAVRKYIKIYTVYILRNNHALFHKEVNSIQRSTTTPFASITNDPFSNRNCP